MQEATYTEGQVQLDPGDSLLLFTDGAIEVVNAQGQPLEERGFLELVQSLGNADLDLGRIERALLEFTNQIRLPDDLTLLSVDRAAPLSA